MESKPKACCANCLKQCFCQMCSNPDTGYCTDFEGPGLTPQMKIEELKMKNEKLRARIKHLEEVEDAYNELAMEEDWEDER